MNSKQADISIEEAAKRLGRHLCGRVPHVVGVSLRRRDPNKIALDLYVDIDAPEAAIHIPASFHGYEVHVRLGGTPRFLANIGIVSKPVQKLVGRLTLF